MRSLIAPQTSPDCLGTGNLLPHVGVRQWPQEFYPGPLLVAPDHNRHFREGSTAKPQATARRERSRCFNHGSCWNDVEHFRSIPLVAALDGRGHEDSQPLTLPSLRRATRKPRYVPLHPHCALPICRSLPDPKYSIRFRRTVAALLYGRLGQRCDRVGQYACNSCPFSAASPDRIESGMPPTALPPCSISATPNVSMNGKRTLGWIGEGSPDLR